MSTPAQAAASRANARASTGPRTAAGKAKVAGNARRHGLWVAGWGLDAAEADALARRIAETAAALQPRSPAAATHEIAALDLAHAVLELRKVRRHRAALLEAALAGGEIAPVDALLRLDRYERRARTHRRTALRALDAK